MIRSSVQLILFVTTICGLAAAESTGQPNVAEIVKRSVTAMNADWEAAPRFSYVERDMDTKHGGAKIVKTYKVVMINGSPYNELIALNDQPLSPKQKAHEEEKMRREIARRQDETPQERQRRIAKYAKERRQDHAMIQEMVKAFNFKLEGEPTINGRKTWELKAIPNPNFTPETHEDKVLTGMQGTLWVDQQTYQWVKVEADVIHPVAFFGFLAKVEPGTHFQLEQAPVAGDIWQPVHFSVKVNASALGFLNEDSSQDETYRDYQPASGDLAMQVK